MEELVSVIMPAYNAAKYIAQSISSVANQTYKNWELVVVNDGSTDNTEDIILSYVSKYPDKIHYYKNEKNSGAATALNVAMHHATGKYMCWLSADDLYFDTMIESQVNFLINNKQFDACFSKFVAINEKNELLSVWDEQKLFEALRKENSVQPYYNLLMCGNTFNGCSFLGYRKAFVDAGDFNPDFVYATDYEYWVRMAAVANIGFYDEFNVMSRKHAGQGTNLGRNDIDAVKVFCYLASREDIMRPLFEKVGVQYSKEAVKDCFITREYLYKSRNQELIELLKGFADYVEKL